MTINEMVKEMEQNYTQIMEVRRAVKFKHKDKQPVFDRIINACNTEWATILKQQVITNKRKAEIIKLHKSSQITLNRIQRLASTF